MGAVLLAVAMGTGGTVALGGSSAKELVAPSGSSSSRAGDRGKGPDLPQLTARLSRQGVRIEGQDRNDASDCVAHSHGQVQTFFRDHPCTSLRRLLLRIRDRGGNVALVAIASVRMPSDADARELKELLDKGGTGNITELSRERGRYRTVRFTGDAYASRRDGALVVNAQAQPVVRGSSGLALTSIVTNVVR